VSLRFGDDCQDFDGRAGNIVKYTNLAHAEPVLRPSDAAEPFDTAAARLPWLVSQMPFERRPNARPRIRLQQPEVFDGFGGKSDIKSHYGQNMAQPKDR
jgi:hypothetical protein